MENNDKLENENNEVKADQVANNVPNGQAPESVWADGVPAKVTDEDKLTVQQLQAMAVKYIAEQVLAQRGFRIEPGFPRMASPNIVCEKDGKVYAIIAFPSVYPQFVGLSDEFRLKFVDLCKKNNSIPLFAPVGYRSVDEERAKASLVLKGDVFRVTFPGFLEMTDVEKFDYTKVTPEMYFRP